MTKNKFDEKINYRLFRTVKEVLHPTISKKNISDYQIIINEELLPLYIYYPRKVSNLNKVIIYIHGSDKITNSKGKYPAICKKVAEIGRAHV